MRRAVIAAVLVCLAAGYALFQGEFWALYDADLPVVAQPVAQADPAQEAPETPDAERGSAVRQSAAQTLTPAAPDALKPTPKPTERPERARLPDTPSSELSALARMRVDRSSIITRGATLTLEMGLTQPVPFRAYLLDSPPRLVVDFREVDFAGATPSALMGAAGLKDLRWGPFRPGWSRMVAELSGPMAISTAQMRTQGEAALQVRLVPVQQADFAARTGAPLSALWDLPQPAETQPAKTRQRGEGPLLVVLDPGHGGIDPGAQADGQSEAVLMMTFARELKEVMTRAGMQVVLTREEDVFVPLETRITVARLAGADLFLSLHADALEQGQASGATVYTFAPESADAASQALVARHDRADLLAGVDLGGHDEAVADVLIDMARAETLPRNERLSVSLTAQMRAEKLPMLRKAAQKAAFSVLKSPDFPSALIELGFLSSEEDRARLNDAVWRSYMAEAITKGVQAWARGDAQEADLLRQ